MSKLLGETVSGRPLPECPAGHRAHSIEMLTDHRALSNTQVYSVPILLSPRLNRALNLHDILKKKKKKQDPKGSNHFQATKLYYKIKLQKTQKYSATSKVEFPVPGIQYKNEQACKELGKCDPQAPPGSRTRLGWCCPAGSAQTPPLSAGTWCDGPGKPEAPRARGRAPAHG